jgi:hypothetical protein
VCARDFNVILSSRERRGGNCQSRHQENIVFPYQDIEYVLDCLLQRDICAKVYSSCHSFLIEFLTWMVKSLLKLHIAYCESFADAFILGVVLRRIASLVGMMVGGV